MKKENPKQELEDRIQAIYDENDGNYGYRRIKLALRNKGYKVNYKAVQRIMRKLGLRNGKFSRKTRKYSSYKGNVGEVAIVVFKLVYAIRN
ncbi:IS3 family transposase [Mesobacillus campisalis]|uniref:IS3 family transposase n=1 Tax=Mesobacillus campisalis TaxID=1408103 RepID=UPI003B97D24C